MGVRGGYGSRIQVRHTCAVHYYRPLFISVCSLDEFPVSVPTMASQNTTTESHVKWMCYTGAALNAALHCTGAALNADDRLSRRLPSEQ